MAKKLPTTVGEFVDADLYGEIKRRQAKVAEDKCPYCLHPLDNHFCKVAGKEQHFRGVDPFPGRKV